MSALVYEEYHSWWTWRRKMEKDSWAEYTLWLLQFTVVARMSFLFENLRCKVKSGASETENEKKNFYQKSFWTFSWNMKNYFSKFDSNFQFCTLLIQRKHKFPICIQQTIKSTPILWKWYLQIWFHAANWTWGWIFIILGNSFQDPRSFMKLENDV